MCLYEKLLKEEYVVNLYNGIENNRRIPISHGFHHINNVLNYCKVLAELFNLNEEEMETLFTSAVMHDVAQAFLQPNHAYNGSVIVKEMLEYNESIDPDYIKSKVDIDRVCNIIKNHGGKKIEEYEDVLSSLLILADKLDITKDRLRPRYKDIDFLWFMESIEKIDIELEDKVLKIIINTNEDKSFDELNTKGGLDKILKILDIFDNRFNLKHEVIVKFI